MTRNQFLSKTDKPNLRRNVLVYCTFSWRKSCVGLRFAVQNAACTICSLLVTSAVTDALCKRNVSITDNWRKFCSRPLFEVLKS